MESDEGIVLEILSIKPLSILLDYKYLKFLKIWPMRKAF